MRRSRHLKKPVSEVHVVVDHPTCGPCLPDEQASLLSRVEAILRGRTFLEPVDLPDALRLSRDRETCEFYVKMDAP